MPHADHVRPPADDAELAALKEILQPIFHFPTGLIDRYIDLVGPANFRVLAQGSAVAGGLALLPMGQFYGGRSVPMTGIAVVGVAAEHRSRGTATLLMSSILRELHESGVALSALYPATLPLYRRVGYSWAGSRYEIRLPLRLIELRERTLQMRRFTADDEPAVRAVYNSRARATPGHLDRTNLIWKRTLEPRGESAQGFVAVNQSAGAGEAGRAVEGYTFLIQKESPDAPYSLHLTDLVASTPAAGRRLLSFLADYRSMADQAVFFGSPTDPILRLLPDKGFKAQLRDHWMLRIVDVKRALESRGYAPAPGFRTELHLDIRDDLLAANAGKWLVRIENGNAEAAKGGRGEIIIDIRALASLYTGFASPHDLMMEGLLETAAHVADRGAALASLAAPFAGPAPWMSDMF